MLHRIVQGVVMFAETGVAIHVFIVVMLCIARSVEC